MAVTRTASDAIESPVDDVELAPQTVEALARVGITPAEWRTRAARARQLLDEWSEGDEEEQRRTWEQLREGLEAERARVGARPLFP